MDERADIPNNQEFEQINDYSEIANNHIDFQPILTSTTSTTTPSSLKLNLTLSTSSASTPSEPQNIQYQMVNLTEFQLELQRQREASQGQPLVVSKPFPGEPKIAPLTKRATQFYEIDAWDCSAPHSVQARAVDPNVNVCPTDADMKEYRNATVQIAVQEKIRRVKGYSCTIVDTRVVKQCGAYDHETTLLLHEYTNQPMPPSTEDCRNMILKLQYNIPGGLPTDLRLGASTSFTYFEAGSQEIESEYDGWRATFKDSAQCNGGDWKVPGTTKVLGDMIVAHRMKVTIQHEEYTWDQQRMKAVSNNRALPCGLYALGCTHGDATYIWDSPHQYCPYKSARTARGVIATDGPSGEQVFVSTDGSMVRLVLKHRETQCERVVYTTSYDDYVVLDTHESRPFTGQADAHQLRLYTYYANRDEYLYHHLIQKINDELAMVLRSSCEQNQRNMRTDFFIKHAHPGMVTYGFGNGTFATTSGEVLYYHRCRKELVTASSADKCYDALPIRISEKSPLRKNFNATQQWYLEPLTHRLTRYAQIIPCSHSFAPRYQLANKKWIQANPKVGTTEPPFPMVAPEKVIPKLTPDKNLDWQGGGLYDEKLLRANSDFLAMGRMNAATLSILAGQATYSYQYGSGDQAFETPDRWFHRHLESFISFLSGYGQFWSILGGLWITIRIILWLVEWLFGGCQIYQGRRGIFSSFLLACCPSAYMLVKDRKRDRREQEMRTYQDLQATEEEQLMNAHQPSLFRRASQVGKGLVNIITSAPTTPKLTPKSALRHRPKSQVAFPDNSNNTQELATEISRAIQNTAAFAREFDDDQPQILAGTSAAPVLPNFSRAPPQSIQDPKVNYPGLFKDALKVTQAPSFAGVHGRTLQRHHSFGQSKEQGQRRRSGSFTGLTSVGLSLPPPPPAPLLDPASMALAYQQHAYQYQQQQQQLAQSYAARKDRSRSSSKERGEKSKESHHQKGAEGTKEDLKDHY